MELSTEASMKKRKGSLTTVSETVSAPQLLERRSKSGGRDIVAMTLRLSREAWREPHDMALSEDVSINTLVLSAVNEYRRTRGLPPLKPVPSVSTARSH
jgi:predicted HicB family RNase H-like nuclease